MLGEVIVGMELGFVLPSGTNPAALFPELNIASIEDIFQSMIDSGIIENPPHDPNRRTVYHIRLTDRSRESVLSAIEVLRRNPDVAYAEPNYISNVPSID